MDTVMENKEFIPKRERKSERDRRDRKRKVVKKSS